MSSEQRTRQVVRMSVNLSPEVALHFKQLIKRDGLTVTDGIRRAISLWQIISSAHADGETVHITDRYGKRREVVLLGEEKV